MKRPLWFRRSGLHWTPCGWQGWAVIGLFAMLVALAASRWASPAPIVFVAVSLTLTVLLLSAAVLTDDTHGTMP